MLSYISAKEAAGKWNISQRRVAILCSENRIEGSMMVGKMWIIPANAEKPADKRITRREKEKVTEYTESQNKAKYKITIEETISQDFEVEAESIEYALNIAKKNYKNGIFVLEQGNLLCKKIYAENFDGTDTEGWYEF